MPSRDDWGGKFAMNNLNLAVGSHTCLRWPQVAPKCLFLAFYVHLPEEGTGNPLSFMTEHRDFLCGDC